MSNVISFVQSSCRMVFRYCKPSARKIYEIDSYPRFKDEPSLAQAPARIAQFSLILTAVLVVILATVGFQLGSKTYLLNEDRAEFYRHYYIPAVNLACSGRFKLFQPDEITQDFLDNKIDSLDDCDRVRSAQNFEYWAPFHSQSAYMYALVAANWHLLGYSWKSLYLIAGIFGASFAVGGYVFLRAFAFSNVLSFAGALFVLHTPIVIEYIPHLRDFSKAQFILLSTGLLGIAVTRQLSLRWVLALFAAAGLVVGIGRGFRPDTVLILPIAVLLSLVLVDLNAWRASWRKSAMAVGAFLFTFILASLPLGLVYLSHSGVGSLTPHFFTLGFADFFLEGQLKMSSPGYVQAPFYSDEFALLSVDAFHGGEGDFKSFATTEYDARAWKFLIHNLITFPHDMFMRILYALNIVGQLEHNIHFFGPMAIFLLALSVLGLPRGVIVFTVVAGSLIAVSTMQFHIRHYFYMVAFGPALGLCGLTGIAIVCKRWRYSQNNVNLRALKTLALVFLITGIGIILIDRVAGRIQDRNVAGIVDYYASQDWRPTTFNTDGADLTIAVPMKPTRLWSR